MKDGLWIVLLSVVVFQLVVALFLNVCQITIWHFHSHAFYCNVACN